MIWAFFSRRFRLWALFAIGVPLVRRLLGAAGSRMEASGRETPLTRGVRSGNQYLSRYERKGRRARR